MDIISKTAIQLKVTKYEVAISHEMKNQNIQTLSNSLYSSKKVHLILHVKLKSHTQRVPERKNQRQDIGIVKKQRRYYSFYTSNIEINKRKFIFIDLF